MFNFSLANLNTCRSLDHLSNTSSQHNIISNRDPSQIFFQLDSVTFPSSNLNNSRSLYNWSPHPQYNISYDGWTTCFTDLFSIRLCYLFFCESLVSCLWKFGKSFRLQWRFRDCNRFSVWLPCCCCFSSSCINFAIVFRLKFKMLFCIKIFPN